MLCSGIRYPNLARKTKQVEARESLLQVNVAHVVDNVTEEALAQLAEFVH
jgi:hypothetical protein